MIQVQDLHYAIGARRLLDGVNWTIHPGRRAALLGPNGVGKTTILRLLCGEIPFDSGKIVKPKGFVVGYLPQEDIAMEQGTVLQCVLQASPEALQIEGRMEGIHQAMETPAGHREDLLKELGDLEHRYDALGGYRIESEAKAVLTGLGFRDSDIHRPLSEFSGGWRMRGYLGRILLRRPDLLLLDEPTNHLDWPTMEWLEQYLLGSSSGMIVVSHDRFFVDRLAQEIFELEEGKLTHYAGSYRFYQEKKVERREQIEKAWAAQQEEIERQKVFIDRFRAKNTKATQVQSRIKALEKMDLIERPRERAKLNFRISVHTPSFKEVVRIEHLSFRYDQDWVLKDISLEIARGEKLALVGPNGAGKTTLTRLITGALTPTEGVLHLGQRTTIGYYAQHQIEALNLGSTVFDEVSSAAPASTSQRVRDALGIMQFSGDEAHKRIGILSGGEKARVSLAKILVSPVNFLIMDEPVNHLDVRAREALEEALAGYDGTLLLISHDRFFLDRLVHRVLDLEEGRIQEYRGNYSEYLAQRPEKFVAAVKPEEKAGLPPGRRTKEQKRIEADARNAWSKKAAPLKKTVDEIEREIDRKQAEKTAKESILCLPETCQDSDLLVKLNREYARIGRDLDLLFKRWEAAQFALEKLEKESGFLDSSQPL